jgi:glycosyltransferase involved in cell wall biosynthesis
MDKPTRVLILVQNESVPGDRHVWNECRALNRAGYEVSVVCPRGLDRDRDDFERIEGIEIHRYEPSPSSGGVVGFAREYASALRQMTRMARKLAKRGRFSVVHACSPPDFMLLAALSLRLRGATFIFDHHDLTPELFLTRFNPKGGLLYRATLLGEQVAFRLGDVILSVNESYRSVALTRGRRKPEDVFVVRTGPDLTRFRPTEPEPELKRGKRFLLSYVGVMGPQDGVDHAIRALAALKQRRTDWHATFMGDGEMLDEIRRLASELELDDFVEFTGWVEHDTVRRVLSTSDVCLAPDPKNPLNDVSSMVKISEYMAMSRPIVSYALTESRISAGDAAVYAAANDVHDFADKLDALLDDPEARKRMSTLGRKRAEATLAWEHQERSLLAAYERALALRGNVGRTKLTPAVDRAAEGVSTP